MRQAPLGINGGASKSQEEHHTTRTTAGLRARVRAQAARGKGQPQHARAARMAHARAPGRLCLTGALGFSRKGRRDAEHVSHPPPQMWRNVHRTAVLADHVHFRFEKNRSARSIGYAWRCSSSKGKVRRRKLRTLPVQCSAPTRRRRLAASGFSDLASHTLTHL